MMGTCCLPTSPVHISKEVYMHHIHYIHLYSQLPSLQTDREVIIEPLNVD